MPLYDHKCSVGHVFEALAQPEEESMRCRIQGCRKTALRVWISRSTFEREATPFIPPVVFRSASGDTKAPYLFPGRADKEPPPGYVKVELRTTNAVRRFEREYSEFQRNVHHAYKEVEAARDKVMSKDRIDQLRRAVKEGPPNLRRYAEHALAIHEHRQHSVEARRYEPGCGFSAFSFDSSNRDRCDDRKEMLERQRR